MNKIDTKETYGKKVEEDEFGGLLMIFHGICGLLLIAVSLTFNPHKNSLSLYQGGFITLCFTCGLIEYTVFTALFSSFLTRTTPKTNLEEKPREITGIS